MTIDPGHADQHEWFLDRVRHDGDPLTIGEFIQLVKGTGNVRLYGCQLAANTFGVDATQLVPEADGIVDALWFLKEKAIVADHCQYF